MDILLDLAKQLSVFLQQKIIWQWIKIFVELVFFYGKQLL